MTMMSQSSLRCRMASASRSPPGTTWCPWHTPTRKSPIDTTAVSGHFRLSSKSPWVTVTSEQTERR